MMKAVTAYKDIPTLYLALTNYDFELNEWRPIRVCRLRRIYCYSAINQL